MPRKLQSTTSETFGNIVYDDGAFASRYIDIGTGMWSGKTVRTCFYNGRGHLFVKSIVKGSEDYNQPLDR